ncbi:hypothetical protein [Streptomyces canus]|uniref:hypothetical protein n=1 Tax=Streptomyces canus TaxID=58343 RepID=UPI0027D7AF26|nr:hypothetical protein [Streptomyces canus]
MTTGGKTYFYVTDAIGSVVGLAAADGNKVDTYGYSPVVCAFWPSHLSRSPSPSDSPEITRSPPACST